ncbi:lipopolysaccharide transport periplasmic protein LptA [Crenobacter intestini]|uniref:Lipopolysaccharide export system protein LptA n=1 Tax=Crenobacter intestini TaxID=2563443 RepID=A0A4V4N8N1_9NEIS|nr:lipopolysaccharide transport periplasmic protein LptA [Crenobacter intestini]TIC84593.1 lipopolysaccharide transport periplasmic protein LptA [Crenobacter intestini]
MCNLKSIAATALLVALAGAVHAEKADSSKPIELSADRGTLDQNSGVTTWDGNVVVNQGTLQLKADHVVVTRNAAGEQTLLATGKPATFRQKVEGKNEYIKGRGNRIDYDSKTGVAVLTGNAFVERGQDSVAGAVITYNTETELYQVSGGNPKVTGGAGGRVTVILQPKTEDKK